MKTSRGEQLILQSLHSLGQLIVWQTRILSGENAERKVFKGTESNGEKPLTKEELRTNALATMKNHANFMYELFEASLTEKV
jgi:hypothetical protein